MTGYNLNMTFGGALECLCNGARVARIGWNGKGMHLFLVPGDSRPPTTEWAKKRYGETGRTEPYIAIKNAQGGVVPWQPSQSDMLTDDWVVVEN